MTKLHPASVYPGGILILDDSLIISEATREFFEIFECQNYPIIGQPLENLFSPKDRKGSLIFHNKLSRYEKGFIDIIILLALNEKEFITRLRMIKQQTQWFVIVEDILSESDDLFREFHLGRERWTSIVRNSSEGIAMLDPEGRLVEFNSRFLEMMKFRSNHGVLLNEDAIFNKRIFDLIEHPELAALESAFEAAKSKKKLKFTKELFYNQHYFKIELTPIYFPVQGFAGCSFILKDITPQKKLEAAHQEIIHINQVAKTVNSSLNLDVVITFIGKSLQTLLNFDQITIALTNQTQENLSLYKIYQYSLATESFVENKNNHGACICFSENQNYWIKTLLNNQPLYVENLLAEFALPASLIHNESALTDLPKTAIFYPLEVQDKVFGVLAFSQKNEPLNLTKEKILKLQNYVIQIATAINNAKLYEDLINTKIQLAETEKIIALTQKLNEREREYYNLVENINLGVYRNTGDGQGRILKANKALATIFGYDSVEELMQVPITNFYVNPKDREGFIQSLQQQGECRNFELHFKKKDGTQILASINARVQYDEQGKVKWYDGVIEDITERKQAEETLQKLKTTFEHFVPQQFLDRIAKEGVETIELGQGESDVLTILFSDIRAFTTLSEQIPPQKLINFLNNYFQEMNQVIHSHQGFIDKFIGDAIMALFDSRGQRNPHLHAQNAVETATQMVDVLKSYNQRQIALGNAPINIGIGIHTGLVIIGTVGSQDRMDSTVLGDNVNVASRLENLTKNYGVNIIISEQTLQSLNNPELFQVRLLDWARVKGKREPLRFFEVFNSDNPEVKDKKEKTKKLLLQGIDFRVQRLWEESISCFQQALEIDPDDQASQFHFQQCQILKETPLPPDWDGTLNLV